MSKATEKALGSLHGAVAKVLTAQVLHEKEETEFDEDGNEIGTGEVVFDASPATIAAAIKFLKDNSITADMETEENMNNLREALAKKQKRSRLAQTDPKVAALKAVGE